jgi:16S rRNA (cytosine967-C5)-methyltransferase
MTENFQFFQNQQNSQNLSSSRVQGLEILKKIILENQNWDRSLLPQKASSQEKSFLQALCLGVLRQYLPLKFILNQLSEKPLRNKDKDIEILILMAIYEILFLQTPDYAALSEAQKAVPKKKAWAKGFVNAILRKLINQKSDFLAFASPDLVQEAIDPSLKFEQVSRLPEWILKLINTHYPEFINQIETAHFYQPPMHLRINAQKISREDYLNTQLKPGLNFESHAFFPNALTLKNPLPVSEIPGFLEGLISVQDLAPQKTPELLDLEPNLKVLDACAAPGGKSAHLLESCPDIDLISLDIDPVRLRKIQENFARLELNSRNKNLIKPRVLAADATHLNLWWDKNLFDRILIDGPCSGLGVIRRHPEIAIHRKPEEIENLALHQLEILNALWPVLKPHGIMLYATCSIHPLENDGVIEKFLASHPDAKIFPLELSDPQHLGLKTRHGWQFLPMAHGPDGFYYAKIIKNVTPQVP